MGRHVRRLLATMAMLCVLSALATPASHAQETLRDLRAVHQLAAFSTVRIQTPRALGTGWLLQQNGPRPVVITNRHVVEGSRGRIRVLHYLGSDGRTQETPAVVQWESRDIDLAIVRLEADPPASARALSLEPGDVVRGERIVVAGNPDGLPYQTTEGVVTGALPEDSHSFTRTCGDGRNCVVVDAAAFAGSSGGPAINAEGRVVGMLWGGLRAQLETEAGRLPAWIANPSFAFLIHVRTIEGELRQYGEQFRARRERGAE